jgi:anti-anti-sigma factor
LPSKEAVVIGPDHPTLEAAVVTLGDATIVRLRGILDLSTAPDLREMLDRASADGPARLVIDLGGITFLDPAGARPLVALAARTPPPRVTLRNAQGLARRVLGLLGLGSMLEA